jgi:hypothetical protein
LSVKIYLIPWESRSPHRSDTEPITQISINLSKERIGNGIVKILKQAKRKRYLLRRKERKVFRLEDKGHHQETMVII